ncbi:glycosyltransferase [archaeon]|jgi:spore maturation protein CgeB|nr:glycosyltransferase [archaeon]
MNLNSKKVLFAAWGAENKSDFYAYQMWGHTLKKVIPKLESFDTKEYYFRNGKKPLNQKLLKLIAQQKPDALVMIFFNDEFTPETLSKIKQISPQTKTILISCDEDLKYQNFYKFISLFFDIKLISQKPVIPEYKKDKLTNLYFHMDYNTYKLKPIKTNYKYDATFIGRPKADRAEIMQHLADNGIKIGLFGWDWNNDPNLKKYYQGFLNAEDYNKTLNQTRVNLCLTKAGYQEEAGLFNLKGKAFEVALTSSFQLIEYFPAITELFKPKKEIDTFKTKQELLKKIQYYIKNKEQREKIAENSYKRVMKDFNREKHLKKIFTEIFTKNPPQQKLPKTNKKIITLSKKQLKKSKQQLIQITKNYDYINFKTKDTQDSQFKNYFQSYALEKSNKDISCTDYYISNNSLGDYLLFRGDWAFRRCPKEFHKLLDINQLMVKKQFFLNNLEQFKNLTNNKPFKLINKQNTIFISIPLIKIKKLRTINYEDMTKAFEIRFIDKLFSSTSKKNIIFSSYPYNLLLHSITKPFIFKHLKKSILNKNNWDKLILNQKYLGNSLLAKFLKKF